MEEIKITDLIKKIDQAPLKEVRGYFRFNVHIHHWPVMESFEDNSDKYTKEEEYLSVIDKKLLEQNIFVALEADSGELLGKISLRTDLWYYGPFPYDNDSFFRTILYLKTEDKRTILLILKADTEEVGIDEEDQSPIYGESGRFSLRLPI